MTTINVEMGTCRSTWGTMAPFNTKGGVEVSYAPEYFEVMVDAFGKSPIDEILIGEVMKAKVPIAETNYNNLKAVMPAVTEVTGTDGKKKLTIGRAPGWKASTVAAPLVLHPLSYADDVLDYDVRLHKAVPIGEIKFLYELDKERIYEVTFVGLVDSDRSNGDYIGTIGDVSIDADTTAPAVSSIVPAKAATNVAAGTTIALTMSKDINVDTMNDQTISVYKDSDGSAVSVDMAYDSALKKITITPSANLSASTKYVVVATPGLKATNGVGLAATYVSTFTTAA